MPTNLSNMSHLEHDLPSMTTYSDEISIGSGNGNNGVPTLFAVVPLVVEEPEASLIPQIALQRPSEDLFGDQRIFLHAPQYHWHIQGAVGVDEEARQRVVAFAEQMYRSGHRTKARKMELWGLVLNVMEASGVHQLVAQLEQTMQKETTSFAEVMYKYVDDSTGQLEKTLAAHWEEIKALQEQIPILQQQDKLTGTRMDDMQKRLEDIRVAQVQFATDLVEETKKAL